MSLNNLRDDCHKQAVTHSESHGDSNRCTPCRGKPDQHATYATHVSQRTLPTGSPRTFGRKAGWATAWRPGLAVDAVRTMHVHRRGHRTQAARGATRWRARRWPGGGEPAARFSVRAPPLSGGCVGQGGK
jgi:hypothetical protein